MMPMGIESKTPALLTSSSTHCTSIHFTKPPQNYSKFTDFFLVGHCRSLAKPFVFKILYCTEMEKEINFQAKCCQNYRLYQKIVQIKVFEN